MPKIDKKIVTGTAKRNADVILLPTTRGSLQQRASYRAQWQNGSGDAAFQIMRSILALFVVAALGFIVILKKDAPEAAAWETQTNKLSKVSQHNWTKHALDTSRSVAKNGAKRQENQVP